MIESISRRLGEPKEFLDKRKSAFLAFQALPFPSQKDEAWRYTDPSIIKKFMMKSGKLEIMFEGSSGSFCRIKTALGHPELKFDFSYRDKFSAMHQAFWNDGVFIYVEKNKKAKLKNTFHSEGLVAPKTIIVVDENAELAYSEELYGDCLMNSMVEIYCRQNSKISFNSFNRMGNSAYLTEWKAFLEKDSKLNHYLGEFGGIFSRIGVLNHCIGEGSEACVNGVFLCKGEQHVDITASQFHEALNTKGNIIVNGAHYGSSSSVIRGKIIITEAGQKADSHLESHSLMLSQGSASYSIPSLEVDADNVKAGHAATIGKLEDEELFYLMARGLSKKEAEKLIIMGFLSPVMKNSMLRNRFEKILMEKVS